MSETPEPPFAEPLQALLTSIERYVRYRAGWDGQAGRPLAATDAAAATSLLLGLPVELWERLSGCWTHLSSAGCLSLRFDCGRKALLLDVLSAESLFYQAKLRAEVTPPTSPSTFQAPGSCGEMGPLTLAEAPLWIRWVVEPTPSLSTAWPPTIPSPQPGP